ncbi:aspartate/glutamate racemase family protein [Shimia thalassica]|uniref:aspartate/glutamate racemase family protein n=1 Tax=Shimia thalassica TaxID=1715693 RepID=UPI0026E3D38D|nr:aspartate/glutamate racemase family protein [Shimia thalassica]MDO6523222.1 aspartate/glutamate racemase family protein [Shimia thalassica]
MTVILINPNSTEAMTDSALRAARLAAPALQFEGWTSHKGPASIEGAADGALAVAPLLDLVQKASDQRAQVIIIACFDDTGLAAAQGLATCPVIGIGQASFTLARLYSGPASVVTTVQAAVPVIEANIKAQGFADVITHVSAAHVPVLALETTPDHAAQEFNAAIDGLPKGTRNLILGCAGAVSIKSRVQQKTDCRVIDGVSAAAQLCKALVG